MPDQKINTAFERLVGIMDELREKCPWDMKQTMHTLRSMTIEELYELTDSISDENWPGIKEELGDLLLHILFYSRIAKEQGQFTLDEMIDAVCEKLIYRHPHIYGDITVKDEEEVKKNWQKLKLKKSKQTVLSGVPLSLPAIVKAMRLQEKSRQVGFEWENAKQVWEKVEEEIRELQEAVLEHSDDHIEEEFGDLLFSLINYARFLRVDAETALERTNKKFIDRFEKMEQIILSSGKQLTDLTLPEMDVVWNAVKKQKSAD